MSQHTYKRAAAIVRAAPLVAYRGSSRGRRATLLREKQVSPFQGLEGRLEDPDQGLAPLALSCRPPRGS